MTEPGDLRSTEIVCCKYTKQLYRNMFHVTSVYTHVLYCVLLFRIRSSFSEVHQTYIKLLNCKIYEFVTCTLLIKQRSITTMISTRSVSIIFYYIFLLSYFIYIIRVLLVFFSDVPFRINFDLFTFCATLDRRNRGQHRYKPDVFIPCIHYQRHIT